jgi:hypothetical protein
MMCLRRRMQKIAAPSPGKRGSKMGKNEDNDGTPLSHREGVGRETQCIHNHNTGLQLPFSYFLFYYFACIACFREEPATRRS